MASILLTAFGSLGDLYPYLALGQELQKLGHEAVIGSSACFEDKVKARGLRFVAIRPDVDLDDAKQQEAYFDRRRGMLRVIKGIAGVVRESYEDTQAAAANVDAIVTHPLAFAGVLVAKKRNLPWISSVLTPGGFLSAYDPPLLPGNPWLLKARRFGPGAMGLVWKIIKGLMRPMVRPVEDLTREIGLPAREHPLFEGAWSPDLVLALFSARFGPPQPDWPPHTVTTGFPFLDSADGRIAPELAAFLDAGPAPVVFTLGSAAVGAAGDFYSVSLDAVRQLKVRALLLTGQHSQNVPPNLPAEVLAWPYAPHEQVFPRASAIVHQGGIGTTAQAFRAGRPSLIAPFAHDQFDNADRARKLGTAIMLARQEYTRATVQQGLEKLLRDPAYLAAATATAEVIRKENGAATAALEVQKYLARR